MYILKAESEFDSAHFLAGYEGKCRNIHGHRWRVVVEIESADLVKEGQTRGMVVDFGDLKKALKGLCDEMDHCLIYERGTLKETTEAALRDEGFRMMVVDFRPTAENLAKYFYDRMKDLGFDVHLSTVYETPGNCASYCED